MNFKGHTFSAFALLGMSLLAGPSLMARTVPQGNQQPAADNTKTNQRDNDTTSPTADQQKINPTDRAITQKIRTAIHKDDSLSTYGHNVKIITQAGKVTLKGPVRSDEEKKNIGMKAIAAAGNGNVDNQLDVVPSK